ncbi:MAG TPA: DUF1801 domain-containing protein [Candidatus Paceibacterota bacterium]|nr:DUF1801 domain-containing protein [Candidatus Paceibacterota bacterium]
MAQLKTKKNKGSVAKYIASIPDAQKREDAKELVKIFSQVTKEKATMWGTSIVGFGEYHYKSDRSRQEGDWPRTGFSARKQNLSIYVMPGFKRYGSILKKLGPHTTSVGCLYVKRLEDIDISTLKTLIKESLKDMRKKYGP